ncbi:MAG: hypothetical protein ACRC1P_10100 [Cellulosilyticaceae bacterium]
MSKNKLVACMLGTMMLLGQAMPAFASEGAIPVLTLDVAIKQATQTNRDLKANERQEDLSVEEVDFALLTGNYNNYKENYTQQRYIQKQGRVMKDKIIFSVSRLFDEIITLEKELNLMNENLRIKGQELKKQELLKIKGMVNELNIESVQLAYEQLNDTIKKMKDTIDMKYGELCQMIGKSKQRYILEKEDNEYQPYPERGDIDTWVMGTAEEHISIWKAEEDIKVAELPIYTSDYMIYIRNKEKIEQTKDRQKSIEESIETQLKQVYIQMRQLETQYKILIKNITIQEKQIKVNQSYLDKGLISQIEYEKSCMELENLKVELGKLINSHTYLKKQMNNPNLL